MERGTAVNKAGDLVRKKTTPINVPMIANGIVEGYIVAQVIYLADAQNLKELFVPPDDFITDEAFRALYSGQVDFNPLQKYDLQSLTKTSLKRSISVWGERSSRTFSLRNSAIIERGWLKDRAYVLFLDGSVEIETMLGRRLFQSLQDAQKFIA